VKVIITGFRLASLAFSEGPDLLPNRSLRWIGACGRRCSVMAVGMAAGAGDLSTSHNLPVGLTSFVGRGSELGRIESLLARHRLVTVTGPGGSGKTRLAIEAARHVAARFEDGVWLIKLAQLDDAPSVAAEVAVALGLRAQPGKSMTESLATILGDRHLLLLFDNCEHLVGAAAELCEALLLAGVDMRVLATSREPLGVPGEVCFRIPPLAVPGLDDDLETVSEREAVELFLARAGQADPDFVLSAENVPQVATLVRRLDGMPLAIELAAAQLDVLGLGQLVSGLDDRFRLLVSAERGVAGRQASLAATVEWSVRLLDDRERRTFRRVSIFPGPFTLDSASAACESYVADIVARLVRRSLLVAPRQGPDGQFRYGMLETIRVYAAAQLDQSGERDHVAEAVARWTLHEAQQAAESFDLPDDSFAGFWGDAERENVREVLAWALRHDNKIALRLALAMSPWWSIRGHFGEGQAWLDSALAGAAPITEDTAASVAGWLGRLAHDTGDFQAVIDHCTRGAELLVGRGPSPLLIDSLNGRAMALIDLDRRQEGSEQALQAIELARRISYPSGEARGCTVLAYLGLAVGDFAAALSWGEAASAVDATQVHGQTRRWAATALADASAVTGDLVRAEELSASTLDLCQKAGDRSLAAAQLEGLAWVEIRTGRSKEAGEHLDEAIRISTEIGDRLRLADCLSDVAVWTMPGRPEDAAVLWGASRAILGVLGISGLRLTEIRD
jgi:predicted ATPase